MNYKYLIGILGLLLIVYTDLRRVDIIGIFLIIFSIEEWTSKMDKRINNILEMERDYKNNPAYKLDITFSPKRDKISERVAEKANCDIETIHKKMNDYLKEYKEDKNGIFSKRFSYTCFYGGLTNLLQIWDYGSQQFIDEIDINYTFLDFNNDLPYNRLRIAPEFNFLSSELYMGFPTYLPNDDILDEDKLIVFPLGEIVGFFEDMFKNIKYPPRAPMLPINKFPEKLSRELKEKEIIFSCVDINYREAEGSVIESDWAIESGVEILDKRVRYHYFESPYLDVSISMSFF